MMSLFRDVWYIYRKVGLCMKGPFRVIQSQHALELIGTTMVKMVVQSQQCDALQICTVVTLAVMRIGHASDARSASAGLEHQAPSICPLQCVLCHMSSAICPLPYVLCHMSSAICPLACILYHESSAMRPLPCILCHASWVRFEGLPEHGLIVVVRLSMIYFTRSRLQGRA